jgi:hypothetical protein
MLSIGKYKISKNETIKSILVNEGGLDYLTKRTRNNITLLQSTTGFIPKIIHIGSRNGGDGTRNSYYIEGEINNTHVIFARKETSSPMAGTTKLYSPQAVIQFNKWVNNPMIKEALKL